MARSSPGVRRVASILNFIADHPGQSFTLTDLVKALKLSRATCHALLTGLVEVGYLYRASDKNYVLGPALAAIGRVAAQHASPLQIAQPEIRALADEFEAICGIFSRERNELVARDRASSVSHVGWTMPIGTRVKMRPTSAGLFLVASPPEEVDAWLNAYTPPATAAQRTTMYACMAFVREHGFQVLVSTSPNPDEPEPANDMFGELPVATITEIDLKQQYRAVGVVSPVFDTRGQVAFALDLSHFQGRLTGAEIMHAGRRLHEACERITAFITGRPRTAAAA